MINLKLTKQVSRPRFRNRKLFEQILQQAVRETGIARHFQGNPCELHVILIGPRTMRRLNRTYLEHDYVTDVLAFEMESGGSTPVAGDDVVAGEIYVCPAVAAEAAEQYHTTATDEIILYVIHGLLHLTGENDQAPAEKKRMQKKQQQIMTVLNEAFPERNVFDDEDSDQ